MTSSRTDGAAQFRSAPSTIPPILSFVLLALLGSVLLYTAGCATTPDPPPPDLSSSQDSTQARLHSIDAADASIRRDLERLDELTQKLDELSSGLVVDDAPLSLLRLVAMNCLNTEHNSVHSAMSETETISLSCQPAHFDRLQQSLEQSPTAVGDDALELLLVIDQARLLRANLRQRLASLPRLVAEHRDFIVDERARLRQIEADLNQRRNLYSNRGWQEVTELLADYRQLLTSLSQRLDEIVELYPTWPARVDSLMSTIYFELADLRRHQSL